MKDRNRLPDINAVIERTNGKGNANVDYTLGNIYEGYMLMLDLMTEDSTTSTLSSSS